MPNVNIPVAFNRAPVDQIGILGYHLNGWILVIETGILGYQSVKWGYWDIEFVENGILGYWDIDSSRRALGAWITVFLNRDSGISEPLYQGPTIDVLLTFPPP